ncbi:MAG: pseudouridine synthase [Kofleriaceae bacterium]|nr:pseudouridine synthase [Kofleriaceae bacterium]
MRLNKFISETGACSRREADDWIASGRVTVNGQRAGVGMVVDDGDVVAVDGTVITARDRPPPVYIALNKPVGITCTTERAVEGNIVDFVDHPERVFPIGRLDKDSEGLILLTNDGDIVNEVLRVEHDHEKEYVVAVDRTITDEFLAAMSGGMRIDSGRTRPCRVWQVGPRVFRIVLTQGLNRQIRKMCEALGYEVVGLQRVRIMHIDLGHLKVGRWRNLTPAEVAGLLPAERRAARPQPAPGRPPQAQPRHPTAADAVDAAGGAPAGEGAREGRAGEGHDGAPATDPVRPARRRRRTATARWRRRRWRARGRR